MYKILTSKENEHEIATVLLNNEEDYEKINAMLIRHIRQERGSLSNDEAAEAIAWLEKQGETSSNWSEEDERMKIHTLQIIKKYWNSLPDTDYGENEISESCYNWIKSLKDHVHTKNHWKPTDDQLYDLKKAIDSYTFEPDYLEELYEDLKKLKEE